jgi:hypothetical protein
MSSYVATSLLRAFQFFDRNHLGYLRCDDVETLIHSLGLGFSKRYVTELTDRAVDISTHTHRIYYKQLTEVVANTATTPTKDDENSKNQTATTATTTTTPTVNETNTNINSNTINKNADGDNENKVNQPSNKKEEEREEMKTEMKTETERPEKETDRSQEMRTIEMVPPSISSSSSLTSPVECIDSGNSSEMNVVKTVDDSAPSQSSQSSQSSQQSQPERQSMDDTASGSLTSNESNYLAIANNEREQDKQPEETPSSS